MCQSWFYKAVNPPLRKADQWTVPTYCCIAAGEGSLQFSAQVDFFLGLLGLLTLVKKRLFVASCSHYYYSSRYHVQCVGMPLQCAHH